MSVPTPHIGASLGEIAPFVLMPGDPLRAKWIAETYLEDPVCYNQVRGMLGYTGTFRGKKVSVQGSGMGMPSMGIYSYELFRFYGVETIVRVGSAGALQDDLNIGDLVVAAGCSSFTRYLDQFRHSHGAFAPLGNFELAAAAVKAAREKGFRCVAGNVLSSDTFYDDDPDFLKEVAADGRPCRGDGNGRPLRQRRPGREAGAGDLYRFRLPLQGACYHGGAAPDRLHRHGGDGTGAFERIKDEERAGCLNRYGSRLSGAAGSAPFWQ